ncbi:MAG TPA: putative porin [Rhizomicrobium sp.]|nr:putative porin [Rhizomicrobium sp.]
MKRVLVTTAALIGIVTAPALAQDTPPSPNATVNLIRLLVKQHVITQEAADLLLKQAQDEAVQAQKQAAAVKTIAAQPAAPQLPAAQTVPPPAGTLRIPYVPQIVKNQIRDEVKKEVLKTARTENWAQPDAVPEWTKRIHLTGDLRARLEYDMFSSTNDPQIVDFQAFNANGPTDLNSNTNPGGIPVLNTTQDRVNRLSIRARLGVNAMISDGVLLGLRLASGGDNGPVSTTQLLGGGFGKKDFWLDQAYLALEPSHWFAFTAGRMPNPFFHSDLVWDPDLNFDGGLIAIDTKEKNADGFDVFLSEGLFPLEYVGSNFPTYSVNKVRDYQKWLWGSQWGFNWKEPDFEWRLAASYYQFGGIQGALSAPCALYQGEKNCSTDFSHPAFMQKGNTLFLTRLLVLDPNNPTGSPEPQFAGLSFNYRDVGVTTELSVPIGSKYRFMLDFDYVHNLAFHKTVACRYAPFAIPITNIIPGPSGSLDPCDGPVSQRAKLGSGPDGFYVAGTFGEAQPRKRWEWNVSVGYKYLEPDAVVDGYTDSDFHLGGTNARGYVVSGSLGLFNNTWLTARWLSASEIYGPPLAIDVIQLDLNAGF